jgi:hypothetical protein
MAAKDLIARAFGLHGTLPTARAIGVSESTARQWADRDDPHDITLRDVLAGPAAFQVEVLEGALVRAGAQLARADGMPFAERVLDVILLAQQVLQLQRLAWADIRQIPTEVLRRLAVILRQLGRQAGQAADEAQRELDRRGAA